MPSAGRGPHHGREADLLRPFAGRWVAQRGLEVLVAADTPQAVLEWLEVAVDNGRYSIRLAVDEAALGPGPLWLAVAVRPSGSVGAYLRLPGKHPLASAVEGSEVPNGLSRSA